MTDRSPEATVPRPRFILHVVLQDDWWGQIYQQGDPGGIFAKDGSASAASPDYRVFGEKVALPSDDVQKATQTFEQCVAVAAGQSPLEETRAAVATGEGNERDHPVLDRALAFVAEFQGDARCALNCLHAEALAAEVYGLQAALQTVTAEREQARLRAYRQARVFEPSMDGYSGAMAVFAAAFPDEPITDVDAIHIAQLDHQMIDAANKRAVAAKAARDEALHQNRLLVAHMDEREAEQTAEIHAAVAARDEARQQGTALRNAVMLAVLNIDLERNGLTPDGNVRARLVAALAAVDRPAPPHEKAALEHVCGLQGFGAIGDECPACNARMARTPGDPS